MGIARVAIREPYAGPVTHQFDAVFVSSGRADLSIRRAGVGVDFPLVRDPVCADVDGGEGTGVVLRVHPVPAVTIRFDGV